MPEVLENSAVKGRLTDRQQQILDFMNKHMKRRWPTVREIAQHFQIYPATVQDHISAIRRKGHLPRINSK